MSWIISFLSSFWTSFKPWLTKTAGFATSLWGLLLVLGTLIWTIVTHIIPIITLCLSTLNSLVTGSWNLAPPTGIMTCLQIANTFTPLQEAMQMATAYGILKASQALFRWLKSFIPTEAGS
jgi:phage-related protein